ncbi:MAG: 4a-hydroxytetrahydrobiopterin dehydratase [Pyrobaculum sp.]
MWRREERLIATFRFKSFLDAVEFVREVAIAAEHIGHHPDIEIRYSQVTLVTSTHDVGNVVTEKDSLLAEEVARIYQRWKEGGRAL